MSKAGIAKKRNSLVYGWGINDADFPISLSNYIDEDGKFYKKWIDPCYISWRGAVQRSKSDLLKTKYPNYVGVDIHDNWKKFSGFYEWANNNGFSKIKVLDKDIIGDGMLYGPDTCCFVSERVNNFLVGHKLKNNHPLGVSFEKESGKFVSQIEVLGKTKKLGRFYNQWEAHLVYCQKKLSVAFEIIEEENLEDYIASALIAKLQKKVDEAEILYQQSLI